ncbi:hypothetical protein CI238_09807 [Colletotrichum incanum]|uniref:Uncharacterized protein n=1 Tax=Colletotrichum incanum TaxID=1573173 RepID=A0A166UQ94_COLIC|nr:hypothetical protein CI238_09807 [Colletotrichum incanum]
MSALTLTAKCFRQRDARFTAGSRTDSDTAVRRQHVKVFRLEETAARARGFKVRKNRMMGGMCSSAGAEAGVAVVWASHCTVTSWHLRINAPEGQLMAQSVAARYYKGTMLDPDGSGQLVGTACYCCCYLDMAPA